MLRSRGLAAPSLKIWAAVAAIALAVHLGGYPLLDADEGRNAEVAREMAATNDYVMPRLDGMPYLDKPVVYFAAEAAAMEVLGPTEVAARLPAYLFTLATAALLFWFARRLWGDEEAWIAVIVFLSIPLTMAFARTVIFDSALTFFIVLAIVAFYFAIETRRRRWSTLAWAAIALGVLTKGPVAIVLPLLVALPYAWRRKALGKLWSIGGLLAFIAIVAPWVWAVSQVVPEFLEYVVVTETAARLATDELKRTGPPWYFLPYVLGGALPWSIVLIAGWRELRKRDNTLLFLLLWVAVPLVFFSLSQSKRPQYILPLMPPIALLVAHVWRSDRRVRGTRAAGALAAAIGAVFLVAPLVLHRTKMQPDIAAVADNVAIALGIAWLGAGIAAIVLARKPRAALIALTIPVLSIPVLANPLMRALGERRSAHAFAAHLEPHLTPDTQIVGVEAFTGSMAFYLRRPIVLASEDASELTSNYLIRRFDKFANDPHSSLRRIEWFGWNLEQCCVRRVYVVRNQDVKWQRILEQRGLRPIARGTHHVAYGPYTGP